MAQKSRIAVIKIFPLAYHQSHLLTATLDFTPFFILVFLEELHPLSRLGCFCLWLGCSYLDLYFAGLKRLIGILNITSRSVETTMLLPTNSSCSRQDLRIEAFLLDIS